MINQDDLDGPASCTIQGTDTFVTASQRKAHATQRLHDINLVDNDKLTSKGFAPEAECPASSSWKTTVPTSAATRSRRCPSRSTTQTPDDLVERHGADTLRRYEMFSALTQHKPWDT